jgi:hypothetical protein
MRKKFENIQYIENKSVLAHLSLILLMFPVTVLFLGIVADPDETHAVWYGMLNTLGIFDVSKLTDAENVNYFQKKLLCRKPQRQEIVRTCGCYRQSFSR